MRFRSIRSRNRTLVVVVMVAAALAAGSVAPDARAGESEEARQAKVHYRNGEEAFKAGRFEQAYQEWEQGYKLSSRPLFLLNMAHAQRRRGDLKNARTLYKRFLLIEPQSKLREEIEGVLAEIDTALASEPNGLDRGTEPAAVTEPPLPAAATPVVPPAPPPPLAIAPPPTAPPPLAEAPLGRPAPPPTLIDSAPPPVAPDRPIYKRWWFWTGTGALIAAGLAGVFLLRSDPYTKNGSIGTIGAPQ